MRRKGLLFTIVLITCLLFACLQVFGQSVIEIYVSNRRGSSLNDGLSYETPFDSIQDAANLIKTLKDTFISNNTQFVVNIEGGRYFINSTIIIPAPMKFNDVNSPTIWRGMSLSEKVVLTGGVSLPVKLWKVVTSKDAGYQLIHPKARGKVYMIDLNMVPNLNVTTQIMPYQRSGWHFGRAVDSSNELFFKRRAQTVARYPNVDESGSDIFLKMEQVPYDGANIFSFNTSLCENRANWPFETDGHFAGYPYWDWADAIEEIVSIQSNGTVFLKPKVANYGVRNGQRFYLTNFLTELDSPGEYIIVNSTLFYWPTIPFLENTSNERVSDEDLILSTVPIIFQIKAEAQTFEGIELEMTTGTAIKSNDIDHVIVNRTVISNTGSNAIWITACHKGCQIVNNIIYENGQGGISINGGIRRSLSPSGILVSNNTVFNFSRIGKTYRAGIHIQGVGGLVSHNHLYNADHVAILWSGNDHVISLNKIHDVCTTAGDMGAIYSGRDWTMRGNLIKHNLIYRIKGPGAGGTSCIYLDDMFSSVDIIENICYDSYRGVLIGGGRDNVVWRNLFIDVSYTFQVDDRGFTRDLTEITQNLFAVPFNNTLWSGRYPKLTNILEDEPRAPKGNDIRFNLISGKALTSIDSSVYLYSTYMNNTFNVPKSIFSNITNLNFSILSSKYGINFTMIPFDEIGLLPSDFVNVNETKQTNNTNPPSPTPEYSIKPIPSVNPQKSTTLQSSSPIPFVSNDTRVVSEASFCNLSRITKYSMLLIVLIFELIK